MPDITASDLTLEEKASLTSGRDFWTTKPIDRVGVPSIMMTDGPHGLRKQSGATDHLGLANSVPATCFPPAVGLGSSWDLALVERVGQALGVESAIEDVAVILGPGINIKRSPLCGRNFEYFSEDPYLAGELAVGIVDGAGNLVGMITDGDLRRHLSPDLAQRNVSAVMTHGPIVVGASTLAAEALKLVQQRPIEGHVKDNFVVGQQHAAGAQVTPKLR